MTYATHISITDAKQNLGELVKRVAYGGESFVIEFRGRPMAVLGAYTSAAEAAETDVDEVLGRLKLIREEAAAYGRGVRFDATEEIRKLRDGLAEWP